MSKIIVMGGFNVESELLALDRFFLGKIGKEKPRIGPWMKYGT